MRTAAPLTLGLLAAGWSIGRPADPGPPPPAARPYGVEPPAYAQPAAGSCAAASCHGGSQPGRPGSEHTVWTASARAAGPHDPHSRAYRILFNDDSVRIARLTGRGPAHRDALCLKCHATDRVEPEAAAAEGVGCGACHGPAERWLTAHYLLGWKGLTRRQQFDEYGFVPTKSLVARALSCAACHVGAADREVNHDLIAAGHPRLNFEYTRFHFQPGYTKHWAEKTPQPDFEVRAWVVGQVASLRAAADLLRARAERATAGHAPWPEFAGYSCYACHRGIGGDEPQAGPAVGRSLGRPGWEVWYTAAAGVALDHAGAAFPGLPVGRAKAVADLQSLMARPSPKPAEVAPAAAAAVAELDGWLAAVQDAEDAAPGGLAPDVPRRLVAELARHALAADRRAVRDGDWDFLAAHYLGAGAAAHAAGGSAANPGWAGPLKELAADLRFPPTIRGTRSDSPAGFGRRRLDAVRSSFDRLLDGTDLTGARR